MRISDLSSDVCSSDLVERTMLARLYQLDHIYGWLVTFGLALMIESVFRHFYGVSGNPYAPPPALQGGFDLGLTFLPTYRGWETGRASWTVRGCQVVVISWVA